MVRFFDGRRLTSCYVYSSRHYEIRDRARMRREGHTVGSLSLGGGPATSCFEDGRPTDEWAWKCAPSVGLDPDTTVLVVGPATFDEWDAHSD
jgi:hypothetical protein